MKTKRLVLVTTGSLGDVAPFVALGTGLANAGFTVRLAAPADAQSLCREYALDFYAIDDSHQKRLEGEAYKVKLSSGNTLQFAYHRLQSKRQLFYKIHQAAYQACLDADGIIYRIGGFLEMDSIAEKLKIPCFKAGLVPYSQTVEFPSLYFSPILNLGKLGNWLSYPVAEWIKGLFFREPLRQFRQNELGLPKRRFQHREADSKSVLPLFYAFSPTLLPKPSDWQKNLKITGHWSSEQKQDWQPPVKLRQFLEEGEAPIYVGFGSMVIPENDQVLHIVHSALSATNQRGILVGNWIHSKNPLPDDNRLFFSDKIPHEWLFPRVSIAIHHGGIGTIHNCLKAGIPSIIIPINYDQPFWGARIFKIGAGPHPIPMKRLNQENLVAAIQACTDNKLRRVTEELRNRITQEDGIGFTVREILNVLPI